jgi:branched-chain amino acid transport system permease protein
MSASFNTFLKLLVLALVLAFPFVGSAFYTELVAKGLILAIFAMSLDLLVGVTGLVSFGHAAYFGVAAYVLALLTPKYQAANLWLSLPVAVLVAGLVALLVGFFVLRTRGIYFIMVTLAFAQMAYYVFHDTNLGGGSDGIYVNFKPSAAIAGWTPFDLDQPKALYFFILVCALAVYGGLCRLKESSFGSILQGIRDNESRMLAMGYATYRYKLAAFAVAGALAGVAGYLYGALYGFVTPEYLSWHQSGNVLLMVILGGMGNFGGAVAGAFAFVAMQEFFAAWTKHWQLLMGAVIVGAVLFLPGGISALPARLKRKPRERADE